MTYTVIAVFIIASLLAFEYTFAKDATNNASLTTSIASPSRNHVSPAKRGLISNEDIEELVSHVGALNKEKSKLDNEWRIERNKHDSMKIRIDDSQKTIRLEMDEVLLNNSPRERLDDLLSQHDVLTRDEKELAKQVLQLEEKLTAHQLLLVQANRDLDRMRALYASQQREQDIQRVQDVAQFLDRELRFSDEIAFKCSTNKSLAACLNDYPLDSIIHEWLQEHYQNTLSDELADTVDQVRLNPNWYTAQINHSFTQANMNLDGSITAEVDVRANINSRKMMACALLKAPADLCETQSVSLIVRSNKYGDKVYINNKPYGPTPLSVMLDPGVYNVEVKFQGLTQKRTLTLDENRHLNFVF